MEKAERVRISSISEAARETLEVAFIADVALDRCGFGDGR